MANKKKTTTKKTATTKKSTAPRKTSKKAAAKRKRKVYITLGTIFAVIIAIALAFLSFYSNLLGNMGQGIKEFFMGIFGKSAYLIPFIAIFIFIYYFYAKRKKENHGKIYASLGLLTIFSAISHLFYYGQDKQPLFIEVFFLDGSDGHGGGIIGGFIAEPLKNVITFTGTFILMFLVFLFLIFVIFNEPILRFLDTAKEQREETRKELEAKEKEEKKQKKLLKKEEELPLLSKKEDNFENIMQIFNDYEKDEEEPKKLEENDLEEGIELISKTQLEMDLEDERDNLTAILERSGLEQYTEVEEKPVIEEEPIKEIVEEIIDPTPKTEEIIIKPHNQKIEYTYPSVELLDDNNSSSTGNDMASLKAKGEKLELILKSFNVEARVVNIEKGPTITRFELQPKTGVRLSKIQSLQDDIKMNLAAKSIRISPIPGKTVVGIEIPNDKSVPVHIKEIISSKEFNEHKSKISFSVGMDITGRPIIGNLAKMPHVLIAGQTGSGKSVCINTLITSILYKANPNEVKLIMVDPKVVELGVYNGIPHLLIPVVTDPKKAAGALHWAVVEMENRYKLFANSMVRNIEGYNDLMRANGDEESILPQIVIIVDELADLMMVAPKDVEAYICRLAQLARAAGMHLVIATQRPSVNVITGLIKANVPSRIAFAVTSSIDSRTILDMGGAEKLLGKGDMLYFPAGESKPLRVQGSLITDQEVERVVNVVKANSQVEYDEDVMEHLDKIEAGDDNQSSSRDNGADDADELLPQAIEVVIENNQASVSMLQRRMKLGYARAARIMDQMELRGIVGPSEGSKPRQILITKEEFYEMKVREIE